MILQRLTNPVIINEMRTRMRGRRAYVILTLYLLVLSCSAGTLYSSIYTDSQGSQYDMYDLSTPNLQDGPTTGKAIFAGTIFFLLILVSHLAPAFTAASISGERERQTYEVLIVTPLKAQQIIWGKLGAVFLFLLLLILTSLPVQSLAFLFGGVELTELIIAAIMLMVTTLAFGALGLYISSLNRTAIISIVATYSILLPFIYGLPFLVLTGWSFTLPFAALLGSQQFETLITIYGIFMAYVSGFLLSINPFSAAILTLVAATNGQGYFFFTQSINNNISIPLVSPWIIYVIFYTFVTWGLIRLTMRQLNHISNY